jgi:protein-tyrosine phosphatase
LFKHKEILLASVAILVASTASSFPLTAQKQTTQKPIRIDATQLQGVQNFRDIGGYATVDGRTIRYNAVYRSAMLHDMTLSDNSKLAPLKIRYEIDLRRDAERSLAPTNWGPNPPKVIDIPFLVGVDAVLPTNPTPPQVHEFMQHIYASNAVINAPAIGEVLHDLAQGDEPALIHCTGGVDRTGMTVAVLMTLLGASRQDVYREYLLSTKLTQEQIQHLAANAGVHVSPAFIKAFKMNPSSSLDAFFRSIHTHYGSFDAYARNGLRLTKQDIQNLRRRLLVG